MSKKRIAQVGTFDVENYGDLLFPFIFKHYFLDYEIDLFSPVGGGNFLANKEKVYGIKDLEKKHLERKYDAIVIGGGDLIRVDSFVANTYNEKIINTLSLWILPILIGKKYNIPVLFNCPGVPYHFKKFERKIIKMLLDNVDYLAVRDEHSRLLLEECDVKKITVFPDTVLSIDKIENKEKLSKLKKELEKKKKIPEIDNYIVFQHSNINVNSSYINEIKNLLNLIIKEYKYNILLMPIGYVHNDIDFLNEFKDVNNDNIKIVDEKLNPIEMLSVIASSCGYIGTSMHGAVTSYAYDKPILLINTDNLYKRSGLLKTINREEVEIKNIYSIVKIFKEHFFDKTNKKIKSDIDKQINNHFENINKVIKAKSKKVDDNFDFNLIVSMFDSLSKINYEDEQNIINVYFDFGNDFNAFDCKRVKLEKKDNNFYCKIDIPEKVKKIRIDPFEGVIVGYKNLQLKSKDIDLKYSIPNQYFLVDKYYIFSTDPNIYVDVNSSITSIDFSIDLEILSNHKIVDVLNNLVKLEEYKLMYESTIDYKLRNIIKKFLGKK